MNNKRYASLTEYTSKLNSAINKIDGKIWPKTPKQVGSLMVTLRNIQNIIDNITEIQKLQNQIQSLPSLDEVAKKDNNSAKKAEKKIYDIKGHLNDNYEHLKKEFFKQMELAGKQCREASRAISDSTERSRFNKESNDFQLMAFEATTEKYNIPLGQKSSLDEYKIDQTQKEHDNKEKDINLSIESKITDVEKLQTSLNSLQRTLQNSHQETLAEDINNEVAQIKKVLPPKTIAITKNALEDLKHSSQLLLDLEQIHEILKTSSRFYGKDGRMQKINKQLGELMPLLEDAIKSERLNNDKISVEQSEVQNKINYANRAVQTYNDVIQSNELLSSEQNKIALKTHRLYEENEKLEERAQEAEREARETIANSTRYDRLETQEKSSELYKEAQDNRKEILQNQRYMAGKMQERRKTLPIEYTNMKKRLEATSLIYNSLSASPRDYTNGGDFRR